MTKIINPPLETLCKHGPRNKRNPFLGIYHAISFIARSISRLFSTASRPAIRNAITMAGTRVINARPLSLAPLARGPVASIRYGIHLAARTYTAGSTAIARLFSPVTTAFTNFKSAHPSLAKAISRAATVTSLVGNSYMIYEIVRLDQLIPTEKEFHWTEAGRKIVEELQIANNFTRQEAEDELESIGDSLIQGYLAINSIVILNRQALLTEKEYERPFFGRLPKIPPVVNKITDQPTIQDETLLFTSLNNTEVKALDNFLEESQEFFLDRRPRMITKSEFKQDNSSYYKMKKEGKRPIVVDEQRLEIIDDVLNTNIKDITLPPPLESLPISSLLDLLKYVQDCNRYVYLDYCNKTYNEILKSLEERPSTLSKGIGEAIIEHKQQEKKKKEIDRKRQAELRVQEEKKAFLQTLTYYGAITSIPIAAGLLIVVVALLWRQRILNKRMLRIPMYWPSNPSYCSNKSIDQYNNISLENPNTDTRTVSQNP